MGDQSTPLEHSIYDDQGREVKVVTTEDDEGRVSQGTGRTNEEAMADAKKPGNLLGEGYSPQAE